MNYKIDLHTHSIVSYDGGLTEESYQGLLDRHVVDCVAITDHNETRFAQQLQKKLGDKIIVGEEITTIDGELVGLFLQETIPAGMTAQKTAEAIHEQGGLVYLPHPFETQRKGLQPSTVEMMIKDIDIVEVFNARGRFRGKASTAESLAQKHSLAHAASSDAHGISGIGTAFSLLSGMPNKKNLLKLLSTGRQQKQYAPMWTYLYPAMNKIKKHL